MAFVTQSDVEAGAMSTMTCGLGLLENVELLEEDSQLVEPGTELPTLLSLASPGIPAGSPPLVREELLDGIIFGEYLKTQKSETEGRR